MVFWGPGAFFRPFPCQPPYTREVGVPTRRLKILAKFALLAHVSAGRKVRRQSSGRPRLASWPLWYVRHEGVVVPWKAQFWVGAHAHVRHSLSCQWCGQRRLAVLRQKTQAGGRSSRAVVAHPVACSALGSGPRATGRTRGSNVS